MARKTRFEPSSNFRKRDESIGVRVRATKAEISTDAATPTPNSRKSRPVTPLMKAMGRKTMTRVRLIAITAKAISDVPFRAASRGDSPSSMCRWMFSTTTMASSTTIPMARTRASRVSVLTEKPRAWKAANVPTMETGIAREGMMVARQLRRKRRMTRTTRAKATKIVSSTSATDRSMKRALFTATSTE